MKIKQGDNVKVITGKDRGKVGKVKLVLKKVNRVVVEKVNIVKKHQKPTTDGDKRGIIEFEAPIHISNVMLIDPKDDKPTRVGYQIKEGKKVRVAKKSKTVLN